VDKDDILRVLLGSQSHVVIGRLPHYIASFFNANTVEVWLGKAGLLHIAERHRDIGVDDLLLLPLVIRDGMLIREVDRPRELTICFQDPKNEKKRYIAVLKFARGKRELWISTFHRAKARQTKRKLKKGRVIRNHRLE
jgi:hypothetical protein